MLIPEPKPNCDSVTLRLMYRKGKTWYTYAIARGGTKWFRTGKNAPKDGQTWKEICEWVDDVADVFECIPHEGV